jgi:hypothetical protein
VPDAAMNRHEAMCRASGPARDAKSGGRSIKTIVLAATLVLGLPALSLAQAGGTNGFGRDHGGTNAGDGTGTGATSTGMMTNGGSIDTPASV